MEYSTEEDSSNPKKRTGGCLLSLLQMSIFIRSSLSM